MDLLMGKSSEYIAKEEEREIFDFHGLSVTTKTVVLGRENRWLIRFIQLLPQTRPLCIHSFSLLID